MRTKTAQAWENEKRPTFAPMEKNDWVTILDAAPLVGRSVSSLRRALPTMPADRIRRVPIPGKGGERILLHRAYLLERYAPHIVPPTANDAPDVDFWERQLSARDATVAHLQRDGENKTRQLETAYQHIADLTSNVQQLAAVNAGLQNKILQLVERVGERPAPPTADRSPAPAPDGTPAPGYWVALAVLLSLVAGLVVYLLIQWLGNG